MDILIGIALLVVIGSAAHIAGQAVHWHIHNTNKEDK